VPQSGIRLPRGRRRRLVVQHAVTWGSPTGRQPGRGQGDLAGLPEDLELEVLELVVSGFGPRAFPRVGPRPRDGLAGHGLEAELAQLVPALHRRVAAGELRLPDRDRSGLGVLDDVAAERVAMPGAVEVARHEEERMVRDEAEVRGLLELRAAPGP